MENKIARGVPRFSKRELMRHLADSGVQILAAQSSKRYLTRSLHHGEGQPRFVEADTVVIAMGVEPVTILFRN
jgi:hypothetical protein